MVTNMLIHCLIVRELWILFSHSLGCNGVLLQRLSLSEFQGEEKEEVVAFNFIVLNIITD